MILVLKVFIIVYVMLSWISAKPQVPCYFIFGDSLVDAGNNNLNTNAKVNYLPYGRDFPDGPTGRFTNGQTIVDIISKQLEFTEYIPPYTNTTDIMKWVNYASGSAGILDESGSNRGENINFNKQLKNHETVISHIGTILKNQTSANELLQKCLYNVIIGNNDYINNYFLPTLYNTSKLYTPEQYAAVLIGQYSQQLRTLYNYEARNVALFGLGPMGCSPAEIYAYRSITCVNSINTAVQLFNNRLKVLVDELNGELSGSKFIYIGSYTLESSSPISIGLRNLNRPCCNITEAGLCIRNEVAASYCLFWDGFHPSEIVNDYVGERSYETILSSGLLS